MRGVADKMPWYDPQGGMFKGIKLFPTYRAVVISGIGLSSKWLDPFRSGY